MKTIRIFLSIVALVVGFAGAVVSKTVTDITNHGVKQNGSTVFSTVEQNVCDNDRSNGSQCTLNASGSNAAYQVSSPSQPLMRP